MELREDQPLCENANTNSQEDSPTSQPKSKLLTVAGIACLLTARLLDAISLGCAQALGGYVPHFQLNLWRFLAQFAICLVIVICLKKDIRVERNNTLYLVIVCLAYNVENVTSYTASIYLPVSTQAGFCGTFYLVLTTVVSVILDRQCPALHSLVAMALVLPGVLLLTQPEILFGDSDYTINPVCPKEHSNQYLAAVPSSQDDNISVTPVFQREDNSTAHSFDASTTSPSLGYLLVVVTVTSFVVTTFAINKKLQQVNPFVLSFWVGASGIVLRTETWPVT